jgi:hypothetical protein
MEGFSFHASTVLLWVLPGTSSNVIRNWAMAKGGNEAMDLRHVFILLAGAGLVTMAVSACCALLKAAQEREDAEDERLWQCLLHP